MCSTGCSFSLLRDLWVTCWVTCPVLSRKQPGSKRKATHHTQHEHWGRKQDGPSARAPHQAHNTFAPVPTSDFPSSSGECALVNIAVPVLGCASFNFSDSLHGSSWSGCDSLKYLLPHIFDSRCYLCQASKWMCGTSVGLLASFSCLSSLWKSFSLPPSSSMLMGWRDCCSHSLLLISSRFCCFFLFTGAPFPPSGQSSNSMLCQCFGKFGTSDVQKAYTPTLRRRKLCPFSSPLIVAAKPLHIFSVMAHSQSWWATLGGPCPQTHSSTSLPSCLAFLSSV